MDKSPWERYKLLFLFQLLSTHLDKSPWERYRLLYPIQLLLTFRQIPLGKVWSLLPSKLFPCYCCCYHCYFWWMASFEVRLHDQQSGLLLSTTTLICWSFSWYAGWPESPLCSGIHWRYSPCLLSHLPLSQVLLLPHCYMH